MGTKQHCFFVVAVTFLHLYLSLVSGQDPPPSVCNTTPPAGRPASILIGGLFPLTGSLEAGGIPRSSAFRIAIEDINDDDCLLPGTTLLGILNDTETSPVEGLRSFLFLAEENITGVIGAASSSVSRAVAVACPLFETPQISYSSTLTELSQTSTYPFFSRVVPSDAFQGQLLALICEDLGWDRVATISTSNAYGVSIIEQFTNRASALSIAFLSSQTFPPGASSNSPLLEDAVSLTKSSGARIIVVAMVLGDAQNFLRVAREQGLTEYATFLVTDGVAQDALFDADDSDELRAAASGMIGTTPVEASGELYDEFVADWETRDPEEYPGAGNSDINTFVPTTYDATYALAWALDRLVRRGISEYNGTALLDSVQKWTNFVGLTGNVTFDENGDRSAVYSILNFYDSDDDATFVEVGIAEEGEIGYTGEPIIFRDGSTNAPDAAERVFVAYDDPSGIAMVALCCVGIAITLLCTARIMIGKNTPIIVYASPNFILLINLGILIGFCNVFVWTGEPTDSLCQARPWILVLNFVLIFGNLYAKAGRVYHLLHQRKSFVFKPIKDQVLFGYVFLYSLIFLIPLIVWTAAYPLEVDRADDNPDNDKVNIKCTGDNATVFLGLFLGLGGLSLIFGVFISYLNRNFHDFFSEIQYVGYTLYTVTITCCVVLPMLFILEDEPDAFYIVLMLGLIFANFATLLFLFTPKLYILVLHPSQNAPPTDEGGRLQTKRGDTALS